MPASRTRRRRWRSALGCSANPHSPTLRPRRTAVITSCSGLRERACMCTSPAATSGKPSAAPTRCSVASHRLSSGARCSSTANQIWSSKYESNWPLALDRQALTAIKSEASKHCRIGASSNSHPCSNPQGLRGPTWYCPLDATARAAVMNSHRLPQPSASRARATSRRSSPHKNSLPTMRCKPHSLAASQARTTPATEHSSVSARAW